jgi:two-component system, chemotaxis family, chemotaxis protein CheY
MQSVRTMMHRLFARSIRRWYSSEIFPGRRNAWGTEVHSHSPKPWCGMPSILVVDDENQIRRLVRETLEQAGYRVTEASDGKEALQQYRLAPADLVILDILMPNQDGLETTIALRREFPDVKVIVITGGSDMIGILNFLDVAKMLGAHSTLQKPFEMKTLLDTVHAELQE